MRSACVLGIACLLALAAPVAAQTPAPGQLPPLVTTRQNGFSIPFRIEGSTESQPAVEVQLHMSTDHGATWQIASKVVPNAGRFSFRSSRDGEYWFMVRTLDAQRNLRPKGPPAPELRVLVDTMHPQLELLATRGPAGEVRARWQVRDTNLRTDALTISYRPSESNQPWQPVAIDPLKLSSGDGLLSGEAIWWAENADGGITVRAEVVDSAGNTTFSQARVAASNKPPPEKLVEVPPKAPAAPVAAVPPAAAKPPVAAEKPAEIVQAVPEKPTTLWPAKTTPAVVTHAPQAPSGPPEMPNSFPTVAGGGGAQGTLPTMQPIASPFSAASTRTPALDRAVAPAAPQSSGELIPPPPPALDAAATTAPLAAAPAATLPTAPLPTAAPERGPSLAAPLVAPSTAPSKLPIEAKPAAAPQASPSEAAFPAVATPQAPASEPESAIPAFTAPPAAKTEAPLAEASEAAAVEGQFLPPGVRPRMVNSRKFELEYDIQSVGSQGITRVELWATRDGGKTWASSTVDADNRSPLSVTVDGEGLFGFRLVLETDSGARTAPPKPGNLPEIWVGVDTTKPLVRLLPVDTAGESPTGELTIRWEATDQMLAARPVALAFGPSPTGPWTILASGLENSGHYAWRFDSRVGDEVFLRLEVRDEAGNIQVIESATPLEIVRARPQGRITNVRPVGDSARKAVTELR